MRLFKFSLFCILFLMAGCATNNNHTNDFKDYRINHLSKDSASITYIQGQYEKYDDVIEKSKLICSALLKTNIRRLNFNIVSSKEVKRYIAIKFIPVDSSPGFNGKHIRDLSSSPTVSNQGDKIESAINVFEIVSSCNIITK